MVLDNCDAAAKRRFDVNAGDVVGGSRVKLLQAILQVRLPLLQDLVDRVDQWRAYRKFYHEHQQQLTLALVE